METDDINKKYEEAIVDSLARKLKTAGYSLNTNTLIGWLVGALFALIAVVYGTLVTADASQKGSIVSLQADQASVSSRLQRIEGNIYQICRDIHAQDCLPPIQPTP